MCLNRLNRFSTPPAKAPQPTTATEGQGSPVRDLAASYHTQAHVYRQILDLSRRQGDRLRSLPPDLAGADALADEIADHLATLITLQHEAGEAELAYWKSDPDADAARRVGDVMDTVLSLMARIEAQETANQCLLLAATGSTEPPPRTAEQAYFRATLGTEPPTEEPADGQ